MKKARILKALRFNPDGEAKPSYAPRTEDGWCEFKTLKDRDSWTFHPTHKMGKRKLFGPAPGDPPRNVATRRCPLCSKRLRLWANFCIGGEFICWVLPDHKPRVTRKPGPKRQSKQSGRGK